MSEIKVEKLAPALLSEQSRKRNLIFKGGSIKGIAYVGVRAALEFCGFHLDEIERVGGTSAGAMNALAFALNLSIDETKRFVLDLDFKDLLDDSSSPVSRDKLLEANAKQSSFLKTPKISAVAVSALPQLSGHLGLYPGEFVREWIEALLFHKTKGIRNCTFQELHNYRLQYPDAGFKDLYVVGFNLNTKVAKTFSVETTPSVIIADAIRISMSIPFLFQPHCPYYKIDGVRKRDVSGHYWIDGGIVENYPIHLFDWGQYVPTLGLAADIPCFNEETLGFYFTDARKKDFLNERGGSNDEHLPADPISGIQDYSKAIQSVLYGREYNEHVRRHDNRRTIYIDPADVGLLDFNLSSAQKRMLISAGWNSVCEAYGRSDPVPEILLYFPEKSVVGVNQNSESFTLFASTAARHRKDGGTQVTQVILKALIDNSQIINETRWVLALIRKKHTEHAFLLVEGKREQERKIFRSDLFLASSNQTSGACFDSASILDKLWSYSEISGHGTAFIRLAELNCEEYDALVCVDNSEYQSWSITVDEAEKLFEHLIVEAEKPRIPYHIAGDHPSWASSASTLYYHNCASWCQDVIRKVFDGRIEVGSCWSDLIKRPSDVIRQVQETKTVSDFNL